MEMQRVLAGRVHRDLLGMGDLNFTKIPGEVDT